MPPVFQQTNGQFEEDMGYRYIIITSNYFYLTLKCVYKSNAPYYFRTMTKEENSTIIQDRRMSQNQS